MGKISELDAANEINREDRSCTDAGYIMELAIKHTRGEIEQLTDHLKAERDLQQQDMYREMIRIEQEELNVLLDNKRRFCLYEE